METELKPVKVGQDKASVEKILENVEEGVNDFLVIRYITAILKLYKGDESKAIEDCSKTLKIKKDRVKAVWDARYGIIKHNEVLFQLSGDVIKRKIRVLYDRLLNTLLDRDFSQESVKVILEALRTIAQIEARDSLTDSMASPRDVLEKDGQGNVVSITRDKCVILVPMPNSAQRQTIELSDGTLINDDVMDTETKREMEEVHAKTIEVQKKYEDTPTDVIEEVKEIEHRVMGRKAKKKTDKQDELD